MTYKEANATGTTRYIGQPCCRHPESNGVRQTANKTCVRCQAERTAARQRTDKHKAWQREYGRAYRERNRVALRTKARERRMLPAPRAYQRRYHQTRRLDEGVRSAERARSAERRKNPAYNAEQIQRKRRWKTRNRERYLATSRAYDARQLRENLQRRLSKNLRHRLCKAMRGKTRGVSAVRDLGMPIVEFRDYIEAQFRDGMTWANYGRVWHLDHKRPFVSFDLTDTEDVRRACHFTNLQPLLALANQRKHGQYTPG